MPVASRTIRRMTTSRFPEPPELENKVFLFLLLLVSIAFVWVLLPFFGAIFWSVVLAILFAPLNRRLKTGFGGRRNWAALATLGLIVLIVIIPLTFVTALMAQQGTQVYARIQSGDLNVGTYVGQVLAALPNWVKSPLERFGLGDFGAIQHKLTAALAQGSQLIARQALSIGQNTFDFLVSFFIMLYLVFFLIRDGGGLTRQIIDAFPLQADHKRQLFAKFTTVVRATVKGNVVVALVQGGLGGLAFWALGIHGALLWAVLMAFLSLLPAIGAGLVWVPVAVYFLATGAIWQGVALVAWCGILIGLVDNVLRPVLVGKDIKMPDYLVLISTLGGMALFGLNGFVIGPVIAALFISTWDIFAADKGTLSLRD